MRLDEYVEALELDESAQRRQLAEEKSYEVLDYLDDVTSQFESVQQGDSLFGSSAPSVFVGRNNYPDVSAGILSPMAEAEDAQKLATSSNWYANDLDIDGVLQRRGGLLNSRRTANVNVHDSWDDFVGVQREVAIASGPVDVEIGLASTPDLDLSVDDVTTPTGPRARADSAELAENPSVSRAVKKTLEDDDWQAEGAMSYLYRRGLDVYEINRVLSAGALGESASRRLVPTRWSITAVDDTIGRFLQGGIRHNQPIDAVEVWMNEYVGNRYWVILVPGHWEFELVEMKSPGSVWNPNPEGDTWLASAHEGYEGRSQYVDETAGAYYAARLGVLEALDARDRQAKCLVLREVSDDYWAPVGVWQIRESVRNAFEGDCGTAETFRSALETVTAQLPVGFEALQRNSHLVSGLQTTIAEFG